MPASPAKTPNLGLPRFAADDSSAIWVHLNRVVDWLDGLFGPWKSYTPVWTQSDGTLYDLGSGSIEGRYCQIGKLVIGQIRLTRAADSNIGTGNWLFSLPPVEQRSWNLVTGGFACVRNGNMYAGATFPAARGLVGAIAGDLGRVSNTIPRPDHADGDWYTLQFIYEAV